jgi:hypothetical protein
MGKLYLMDFHKDITTTWIAPGSFRDPMKMSLKSVLHHSMYNLTLVILIAGNICFIKIRSKHSNDTLLSLLRIFMKQMLRDYMEKITDMRFAGYCIEIYSFYLQICFFNCIE